MSRRGDARAARAAPHGLLASGLSARLRAVAELVPAGAAVADIGTDHAQLLAWLRGRGRVKRAIGVDVRPGPLTQARRTLAATGRGDVELRQGDGLTALRAGEADAVVLAGMGGARVRQLVDAAPPGIMAALSRLVLQPNTEWTEVRRWLKRQRWPLLDERMVVDRGKFYVVLAVVPRAGLEPGWSEDELVLGPRLRQDRPGAFNAWVRHERQRLERALHRASRGRPQVDPRCQALREQLERFERA